MLGVRTEAGTKCLCFFLSSFTGGPLRLPFLVFPAPDPSWCFHFSLFYSFFFLFISSLFFSSFFTHVLHLPHSSSPSSSLISSLLFPSPSSFSKEGSYRNMSSIEAEIGETLKTSLKDAGLFTYLYCGCYRCLGSSYFV